MPCLHSKQIRYWSLARLLTSNLYAPSGLFEALLDEERLSAELRALAAAQMRRSSLSTTSVQGGVKATTRFANGLEEPSKTYWLDGDGGGVY